jgi:hypothetical protein
MINGNYERAANISERHNMSYEAVLNYLEAGKPATHLESDQWVNMTQAAKLCCVEYTNFSMLAAGRFGAAIDQQSKSLTGSKGRRGCGVLFFREDLLQLMIIRRTLSVSLPNAFKFLWGYKHQLLA